MTSIHVVRHLESISTEEELIMKLIQHNYNGFSACYTFLVSILLYFLTFFTLYYVLFVLYICYI